MRTSIAGKASRRSSVGGFTYVMVLVAVVVVGVIAGVAHGFSSQVNQADSEAELIFRGTAYKNAIRNYYLANKSFPRALAELTRDPNHPARRYLRMEYPDPFAQKNQDWILVRAPDGGISGVASRGAGKPLKQANFPKEIENFAGAESYSEWVFEYLPAQIPGKTTKL